MLAAGTLIGGDFRVLSLLGEGGMGAVYVAEQVSTGMQRAVKLMRPETVDNANLRARFVQEARVGARIESDHIVQVIAAGIDPQSGAPFIAMELLRGEDLAKTLARRGALPGPEVAIVADQLCHALAAAHDGGVVHRDLKAENVFLASSRTAGAPFMVKVLDFGIAKVLAEARAGHASKTAAMGTPMWMAPEQTAASTSIGPAADLWPLGLLFFQLLTGRYFWRSLDDPRAGMQELFREILVDPIPAASARAMEVGRAALLPPGFDAWFARCLQRDPHQRFAHAREAYAPLAAVLRAPVSRVSFETIVQTPEPLSPAMYAPVRTEITPRTVPAAPTAPPAEGVPSSVSIEALVERCLQAQRANQRDRARGLALALSVMGYSRPELSALVAEAQTSRSTFRSTLGEGGWMLLRHPARHEAVSALLTALTEPARLGALERIRAVGKTVDAPGARLDASSSVPFARCFYGVSEVLSVAPPVLCVEQQARTPLVAVVTVPRASLVSAQCLSGLGSRQMAFLCGHHLASQRRDQYIRVIFRTASALRMLCLAALRMVFPKAPLDASREPVAAAAAEELARHVDAGQREAIRSAGHAVLEAGGPGDLDQWLQCSEIEALRAGLLCCGSIEVALSLIGDIDLAGDVLTRERKREELLRFAVSEEHFQARTVIGAADG